MRPHRYDKCSQSTTASVPPPSPPPHTGEGRVGAAEEGQAGGVGLSGRGPRDCANAAKTRVTLRPNFSSMALSADSSTRVADHRNRNPCTVHITRPVKIAAKITSDRK